MRKINIKKVESKWVSPDFIIELFENGMNVSTVRNLIKEVPPSNIFEYCAREKITPSQAAKLLEIRKQSDYFLIRVLQKIKYIFT